MARIRSIKPDFWKSEKVAARLPGADGRQARLLFIGMWNFAEDSGAIGASPAYLRSEIFGLDEDVTSADVTRWLEMLEAGGFIVRYQRDGRRYAWVRGFLDHQRIDKPSKSMQLPLPSEEERSVRGGFVEPSANPPGALPVGREWKGMEGNGEILAGDKHPPTQTDMVNAMGGMPTPVSLERRKAAREKPAPDPRLRPLQDKLCSVYLEETGDKYLWRGPVDTPATQRLMAGGSTDEEILRRWRLGLSTDDKFKRVSTVAELASKFNALRDLTLKAKTSEPKCRLL